MPVGPDWTGNENIIGYPDGLQPAHYVTKPALELIRHALESANAEAPHFLILDEMNLSHVERYFADILSAIESQEAIPLYEGPSRKSDGQEVPRKLPLPDNLFIIGTVNVDETTYMFSPKVLDRANVIEFRMEPNEMAAFLAAPSAPRLEDLDGKGTAFGSGFVAAAADKAREVPAAGKSEYEKEMVLFFNLLRDHNAEFGYRTGYEAARFVHFYHLLGGYPDEDSGWFDGAMDAVVVQKLLPKLHGSRSKLEGLLWALAWACGAERAGDFVAQLREVSKAEDEAKYGPEAVWDVLKTKDPGGSGEGGPLSVELRQGDADVAQAGARSIREFRGRHDWPRRRSSARLLSAGLLRAECWHSSRSSRPPAVRRSLGKRIRWCCSRQRKRGATTRNRCNCGSEVATNTA